MNCFEWLAAVWFSLVCVRKTTYSCVTNKQFIFEPSYELHFVRLRKCNSFRFNDVLASLNNLSLISKFKKSGFQSHSKEFRSRGGTVEGRGGRREGNVHAKTTVHLSILVSPNFFTREEVKQINFPKTV